MTGVVFSMKSYYDYMNEISADELYDGLLGYGLFSEKLPPIFSAVSFLTYCKKNPGFKKEPAEHITYNSMRNLNIPRTMGIPNPMQYEILCATLKNNWPNLQQHFQKYTMTQPYRISRIHIRKAYDKANNAYQPKLFQMNYSNWRSDGTPENDLLFHDGIAKKYVVHADISTCFPSIYTHSLPWALVGKEASKADKSNGKWYNKIDKACQNTTYGETHGLLIGPHASNLLAEIILVVVDHQLYNDGYRFVRHIDDYDCYVESYEQAQLFMNKLEHELRQFDLPLNYKKTRIEELPIASTKHWKRQLSTVLLVAPYGKTSYTEVNNYLDAAIKLAEEEKDSAILNYAIKVLSGLDGITENGKSAAGKRILHLSILYPYLLPLLEEFVFVPFATEKDEIKAFTNALFVDSFRINNFEGIVYSIYYSLKYGFEISGIDCAKLIDTGDCLCLLMSWLYFRIWDKAKQNKLEQEAKRIAQIAMNRNWLFCYEALDSANLPRGDWQTMKNAGVSFLK